MCSIGGFYSPTPLNRRSAFRLASGLLYYGKDRGQQSSGVWADGRIFKKAVSPLELMEEQGMSDCFSQDPRIVLCHTRQPTCGELGDEQAQPFYNGGAATIHNGVYRDTKRLKDTWGIKKQSGVDSELVTSFIDEYGIDMLPEFLKSTDGPSAIAAAVEGKLYLARDVNPTFYTYIRLPSQQMVFIFASTYYMLDKAIRYVWLLPTNVNLNMVTEGVLHRVGDNELASCGRWHSYTQVGYHRPYARDEYNSWRDGDEHFYNYHTQCWEKRKNSDLTPVGQLKLLQLPQEGGDDGKEPTSKGNAG